MIPKYHIKQTIKVAVDNAIFTVQDCELYILLIQMKKKPFEGMWALPGGLVRNGEILDEAAMRILKESTAITNISLYLEQLYTFGGLKRDPFGRVISVAYFALISSKGLCLQTIPKYSDVRWWPVSGVPKNLSYDHKIILRYALQRLQWKLEYTNIAWSLLPSQFTVRELQRVYKAVFGKDFDKRNFRKKILRLELIEPVGERIMRGAHRPAMLYRFKSKKMKIVDIL